MESCINTQEAEHTNSCNSDEAIADKSAHHPSSQSAHNSVAGTIHKEDSKPEKCEQENCSPAVVSKDVDEKLSDNTQLQALYSKLEDTKLETLELFPDNIGDTVYSKRFLLDTMLKLCKISAPLSEDTAFENALCSVWDMTTDKDVVEFILQNDAIDIFAYVLDQTEDMRLKEILIGIIANLCHQPTACLKVKESSIALLYLLGQIHCPDTESLVQLMRFIAVFFANWDIHFDVGELEELFGKIPNFSDGFIFILNSSVNVELLQNSLIALDIFLRYLGEYHDPLIGKIFQRRSDLIFGPVEAFRTLFFKNNSNESSEEESDEDFENDDETGVNHGFQNNLLDVLAYRKVTTSFFNIIEMMTSIEADSDNGHIIDAVQWQLLTCYKPILRYFSVREHLIGNSDFTDRLFLDIQSILKNLRYPFNETIAQYLLQIYDELVKLNDVAKIKIISDILGPLLSKANPEDLNNFMMITDTHDTIRSILESANK